MKKVILSFALVLAATLGAFAQNKTAAKKVTDANKPVFKFEKTVIDYGTIEQGSNPVRYFVFKNVGKSPLIISSAHGSCGCTVPTWPKEPIKPGETSKIKVHYDTHRLGPINKSVTVISNATEPQKVLRIKGMVIAPKTSPVKKASKGAPVDKSK